MKQIQILGPGCPKCKALTANAQAAVRNLGLEARIEKVESIRDMARFRVMLTPALVVDGQVRSSGKVLTVEEITALLT
jgi:small redox-active disulfide protein 2